MASFAKFIRPETPRNGVISARDLDIIEVILRYRFSPTSELVKLIVASDLWTLSLGIRNIDHSR